ncbi:MAG: CMGC protein kinase [Amphiamblys sp. WSBS2006]|nr:MAG: CMGC protein kinase [Amphiamblys sp. WSBS2006]
MIKNNLEARSDGFDPVHIVLEHMPCSLYCGIQAYPEIKENPREILYQVLKGVVYINSKKLAHRDLKIDNILIDPKTMAVKICDFGLCCEGKEETFPGESMDWYRQDISSIVDLMAILYLGRSYAEWVSLRMSRRDEVKRFLEAQRNGVVLENKLGDVYEKMKGAISENGLDLFLQLIASERKRGCTTAAEALKHPFFTEGREKNTHCRRHKGMCRNYHRGNPNGGGCVPDKTKGASFLIQALNSSYVSVGCV